MNIQQGAASGIAASAAGSGRVTIVKTAGGVEGWLVRQPGSPVLTLNFAFDGGAALDPVGKAGLGYLISGLMDEGAGEVDSATFMERLAARAISLSFENTRDDFHGSLLTLSRHCDEAFELLSLALNAPRFDADAVERVKAQIIAGVKRRMQSPEAICSRAFSASLFKGHPYAHTLRGEVAEIESMTAADCHAHYQSLTRRDRLKIIAVGDVTPEDFGKLLERLFGRLSVANTGFGVTQASLVGLGTTQIIDMDVPQTVIKFAGKGIMRDDPDIIPGIVANHILGGSAFTSRLFMEVREKRGLAYSVSSSLQPMRFSALHTGGTSTKNDRAAESLAVIREEMAALAATVPDADELNAAKRYITGSYPLRFDTSQKIAGEYLRMAMDGLDPGYAERRNALFDAVTRDDIARVTHRLYGDGQMFVTAVGRPTGL
jgi:zinc protease